LTTVSSEFSARQIRTREFDVDSQGKRILIHRRCARAAAGEDDGTTDEAAPGLPL